MQLGYAIFADAAQVGADGKVAIIGGDFDTINTQSFPAQHPNLAVVMRLNMTPAECGREHRLRITLAGPLGAPVVPPVTGSFTPNAPPGHKGGDVRSIFVVNLAGLVFELPGKYRFQIAVDDKALGEIPLHLVLVPRVA